MLFPEVDQNLDCNMTLKFCKTDTTYCLEFPNQFATFVDPELRKAYSEHQSLNGVKLNYDKEYVVSSKGGVFTDEETYVVE